MKRKILFITGTRADFGKLKALIHAVKESEDFEYSIFCTGMHMLAKYGSTYKEIEKAGFGNVFHFINQMPNDSMEIALSNTIAGLTRYLNENSVDLIVIHGDRIEAMAGAIVGALRNTLVAHIEGGEVSGTIDDLIRHATSKLSHIHFVATSVAEKRLLQLGEREQAVFKIGSPDVDIMHSPDLPDIAEVKERYDIPFDSYAIAMLHPVTTEVEAQYKHATTFVEALLESDRNYIVIFPNNDLGSSDIFRAYEVLEGKSNIKLYPSLRFEYFLTLLKNSEFIVGNSSAGIHEAPVYGVPTIDIGTRQNNRLEYQSIFNVDFDKRAIKYAIRQALVAKRFAPTDHYGTGDSAGKFVQAIQSEDLWKTPKQKSFKDLQLI